MLVKLRRLSSHALHALQDSAHTGRKLFDSSWRATFSDLFHRQRMHRSAEWRRHNSNPRSVWAANRKCCLTIKSCAFVPQCSLGRNDTFGDKSFVNQLGRQMASLEAFSGNDSEQPIRIPKCHSEYYVRAITACDYSKIDLTDFVEILRLYPEFLSHFRRDFVLSFNLRSVIFTNYNYW